MTAPLLSLPLSVMVLNGKPESLNNLGASFKNKRPYHLVDCPDKALNILLKRHYLNDTLHQHIKPVSSNELDEDAELFIFDFESFRETLYDDTRFSEIGVVVVDHSNPEMYSLEFCKQIRDLPIKKVMTTNQANYEIAVEAFNEDIIDAFILREPNGLTEKIDDTISNMQQKYFTDLSKTFLAGSLTLKNADAYKKILCEFIQDHHLVEYYRLDIYGSYLGLDANGNVFCLVVQSENESNNLIDIAENCRANANTIKQMKDRSHLLFLFSESDKRLPVSEWDHFLLPVTHTFEHEGNAYLASINSNQFLGIDREKIKSLNEYLAENTLHAN